MNKKFQQFLRPKSQQAFETRILISQLDKLSPDEKHQRLWTLIKQGSITFTQFSQLIKHISNK